MFSVPDDRPVGVAGGLKGPSPVPWPIGVRGLLTVLGLFAALGLRSFDRGVGTGAGAMCKVAPRLVLDPNTAPPEVLGALPHVGPSLVRKLVEQRALRPFASMNDMRKRVRGLGPATMARLGPHLRIRPTEDPGPGRHDPAIPARPVGPELAQVPGYGNPR
jgi:competence protein ComEA